MSPGGERPEGQAGQVERLLRELAGRDRQLRELTEQSLGFLEELAETRRRLLDREELARRVGQLEMLQADLQRRLRHAGGSVLGRAEQDAEPRPALEVVFWGGADAAAAALLACKSIDLPVSWVGRPDAVPNGGAGPVQWLAHRDAHTPAQCWNLGMAATRAEAVLFLGPGVELRQADALPATIPANAAILSPRVVLGKTAWSGCDEADHLLRLRPRPAPATVVAVPFASPRAFVMRRLALEQLGLFQEDLLGTGALLEWTLRARAHNYEVIAVPLTVHSRSRTWEEQADEHQDGDRLMVIASHRPESLGRALADAPVLWKMDQEQVPGYLARLLARIPGEGGLRMVLERIALGLIEHALPVADAIELVGRHRLELLGALAQDAGDHEQVAAAIQRAGADRPSSAASAFRELGEDLALERRIWSAMIQELERELAERAARELQAVSAQLGQVQAERDALQQLRPELQQTAAERDAHQQALHQIKQELQQARAQVAAVSGERDGYQQALQQVQSDFQQAQSELLQAQGDFQRVQGDFQQAQGQQQRLHEELEQAKARIAATVRERDGSRQELTAVRKQLEDQARLQAQLQQLRSELQQVEQECEKAQRDLLALQAERVAVAAAAGVPGSPDPERLRKQVAQLHRDAVQLAEALAATGTASAEALVRLLQHARSGEAQSLKALEERNGWIGVLLQEVTKRRLVARKLLPHEQAFLEHLKP